MTTANQDKGYPLVLTRVLNATPAQLFKAWTTPEILKTWWCPKPWTTPFAEIDVRTGGASKITMRSPEGVDHPNEGVFLEVVPQKKIVFTDAYTSGWLPAENHFMTAIVTFDDAGNGRTTYTARVLHKNQADRETHEKMGFHEGWGMVATQLEEAARKL